MTDQSKKSRRKTSKDIHSVTGLPGSQVGRSLFRLQGGQPAEGSGQLPVHVSPSAPPASKWAERIRGIYGRRFVASSMSAHLQLALESNLLARVDVNGSPEYAITSKRWGMPRRPSILALRASARRISDSAFTGWPTPNAEDAKAGQSQVEGRTQSSLPRTACLAGWPTPMAGTPAQNGNSAAGNNDSSRLTVALTGWPTPQVCQGPNNGTNRGKDHGGERPRMTPQNIPDLCGWPTPTNSTGASDTATRQGGKDLQTVAQTAGWPTPTSSMVTEQDLAQAMTAGNGKDRAAYKDSHIIPDTTGSTSTPSGAQTEKRGVLNPEFSRWLMGFPAAWGLSGVTAMRSCLRSPRSSSKRS